MTKVIILMASLALAPLAFAAQEPGTAGLEHQGDIRNSSTAGTTGNPDTATPGQVGSTISPATAAELLGRVDGVNAIQVAALLEKIASVTSGKDSSMQTMFAIQAELTRQTGAFKTAHAALLSGKGQDVDQLFAEVIDGKASADPSHLSRIASTYETLLGQFGQLVSSKFLASNSGGIATYHGENHASDAAGIAETARVRCAAYEANINQASSDLSKLLALGSSTH